MGRWCSLVVRGVRRGWLTYTSWNNSSRDNLKERLLLDDIEQELIETYSLGHSEPVKAFNCMFRWSQITDEISIDPDQLYEDVIGKQS